MSTIWTPGGEHEVPREGERAAPERPGGTAAEPARPADQGFDPGGEADFDPTDPEVVAQLQAMQEELLRTPAAVVIANHAFGLFELAALHLGARPPQLGEAQLAIDGLGALVEGLAGRLEDHESQLVDGLTQLRLAYVQIRAAATATPPEERPVDDVTGEG